MLEQQYYASVKHSEFQDGVLFSTTDYDTYNDAPNQRYRQGSSSSQGNRTMVADFKNNVFFIIRNGVCTLRRLTRVLWTRGPPLSLAGRPPSCGARTVAPKPRQRRADHAGSGPPPGPAPRQRHILPGERQTVSTRTSSLHVQTNAVQS